MIKNIIVFFLKGFAMGTANVIPGVSGGTIALITGIFERLIDGIKNLFSIKSIQLFFKGKIREWIDYIDFVFLFSLVLGIGFAIISVARLFEFLFINYPIYIWAFFFGLVFASVWFVAKKIDKWSFSVILFFVLGTAIALLMVLIKPLAENTSTIYLFLCGIIGACSMILPGLSGSFVLVLMGNYELIMIKAINNLDFNILLPVFIGAGIGLLGFSYVLSWIFKKYRNQTIGVLSGFIAGSLLIIWPWKEAVWKINDMGQYVLNRSGDKIVEKYIWQIPNQFNISALLGVGFILLGILVIIIMENIVANKK